MSASSNPSALQRLKRPARLMLGGCLAAAAIGHCTLALLAYLELTPTASAVPDSGRLDALVFSLRQRQPGDVERLLDSADGPMNGSGTMRPAFTYQSLGWSSLIEKLTREEIAALLAQRDAERLAVLSWIRAGADRSSYESDSYLLHDMSIAVRITPQYLVEAQTTPPQSVPAQVKIRSILADRCATCHSATGRNEKARWIPLDTYESLEPYCRAPPAPVFWANWSVVSLLFLIAVTLPAGAVFYLTSRPQWLQAVLVSISWLAVAVLAGAWLVGQPGGPALYILLAATGTATIGTLTMIFLTLSELVAGGSGPRRNEKLRQD